MKNNTNRTQELTPEAHHEQLRLLQTRFEQHMTRHANMAWADVQAKLETNPAKLWTLSEMENTGGEPDVIGYDETAGEFLFIDCSPESPAGRRNVCYDRDALEARKNFKPKDTAMDMAAAMGIDLLTE